MAEALPILTLLIIFFSSILLPINADSETLSRALSRKDLGLNLKKEKLSHLHFYFHDIPSGRNPTAIRVAEAPTTNTTKYGFGAVVMMDDPLTMGPDPRSKIVGYAQGFYAAASQRDFSYLMTLNYVFVEGKYNGSTLSILGKNSVLWEMREMPVVGGSGLFRLARGYAQAKTVTFDWNSGNAVVEYNVYVFHY